MARKSRNHQFDLPPLELQCMKILWALEKGTVREIRARLQTERPLAYTTVMTVMDRLSRKGVVEREKRGRAHLYRPAVSAEAVREHALNRLIENFFQGSRDSLRQHLEHSGAGSKRPAATEPTEAATGAGVNADIDPTLP